MTNVAKGITPVATRTFQVRGMLICREIVLGLMNHRQWFIFRPLFDTDFPDDQYEFVLDALTPESGYSFTPTRDRDLYESGDHYGLEVEE